jgi:6-phosphogluconolactonase (cycloisomerase 2 family)
MRKLSVLAFASALTLGASALCPADAQAARFAYVVNHDTRNVGVFTVGATDLALTGPVSSITTSPSPASITVDLTVRFAYVPHTTSDPTLGISNFQIDPGTGALQFTGNSPAGVAPIAVVVGPTGRFAYAANSRSAFLTRYRVDPATGRLLPVENVPTEFQRGMVLDPTGRFLYALGGTRLAGFSIDSGDGDLTSLPGADPALAGGRSLAMDPLGRFLYVAEANANRVSRFSIDASTGVLTLLGATAVTSPTTLALPQTGRFLYAGSGSTGSISAFAVNPASGALTLVETETGIPQLESLALDPRSSPSRPTRPAACSTSSIRTASAATISRRTTRGDCSG